VAPGMPADRPMHPDNRLTADDEDWLDEVAGADEFDDAEVRIYRYSLDYSAQEYTGLLATLSDVAMLDEPTRARLLAEVGDAIDAHGGTLVMPMITAGCLARAV